MFLKNNYSILLFKQERPNDVPLELTTLGEGTMLVNNQFKIKNKPTLK